MAYTARHRRDPGRTPDPTLYPAPVPAVARRPGIDPAPPLQLGDTQPIRTPTGEGPRQATFTAS